MSAAKRALRSALRERRAAAGRVHPLVSTDFLERLRRGLIVASYRPVGDEADPAAFVAAALAAGCTIALPHVTDRASPLRFLAWQDDLPLIDGPFGLFQPAHDAEARRPDIILTPLLGFDRRGNRLGQGAGHYDRAFATNLDAWRVGIAAAVQEVDALVPDPWDMPLHCIATEREWITT